jgi:hypothetical protein
MAFCHLDGLYMRPLEGGDPSPTENLKIPSSRVDGSSVRTRQTRMETESEKERRISRDRVSTSIHGECGGRQMSIPTRRIANTQLLKNPFENTICPLH